MTPSAKINSGSLTLDFERAAAARPKPKRKRMSPLSVRLSQQQRDQLEQDAMGMSLNAYVLSRLFDGRGKRSQKKPTAQDRAVARALRQMGTCGLLGYLTCQILAVEEGRLLLTREDEKQLRQALAQLETIRNELVSAMSLRSGNE